MQCFGVCVETNSTKQFPSHVVEVLAFLLVVELLVQARELGGAGSRVQTDGKRSDAVCTVPGGAGKHGKAEQ